MQQLLEAIVRNDRQLTRELLDHDKSLAASTFETSIYFDDLIFHWLYAGDSVLHLAAAGYRTEIVDMLLAAGADANLAGRHRGGTPLHYACDGYINGPLFDAELQVDTIRHLLAAGANINAQDKNGATPLHRAVRTRCAAAVTYLLDQGCCTSMRNKPGSTPLHLAVQNTGRGGSGSERAHDAQRQIIGEFLRRGVSKELRDGNGKTVVDCALSPWVKELLT